MDVSLVSPERILWEGEATMVIARTIGGGDGLALREVLRYPAPPREWPYTTGVWRYARGLAFSAKGQAAGARRELGERARLGGAEHHVLEWTAQIGGSSIEHLGWMINLAVLKPTQHHEKH